jgi:hypothetical protein
VIYENPNRSYIFTPVGETENFEMRKVEVKETVSLTPVTNTCAIGKQRKADLAILDKYVRTLAIQSAASLGCSNYHELRADHAALKRLLEHFK